MSSNNHRLFLLDAFALIFRSYFAFARNPRLTSKGMDTSAIFGFTTTLLDLLKKENPTHIAVVFDMPGATKRHDVFPEYKANRNETPEAIKIAVPYIKQILEAFNIPVLGVEGYEADDVIGTLAKKAEKAGFTTFMMTPDKDFGQLVSDNIFMYKPGRSGNPPEVLGKAEVCAKFGIERVEQVIDFLGMMGDAVDNIPGLPGVGEKTAQKLLAQYGSLENTLDHSHELKGKLAEKVTNNKEQGILSKHLATIMLDAPVEFDEKSLTKDAIDPEKITALFEELEFRSLLRKIISDNAVSEGVNEPVQEASKALEGGQINMFSAPVNAESPSSSFKDLSNTSHYYQHLTSDFECEALAKKLMKQKSVCFDTETTSLNAVSAELVGIAFSYAAGKAYYVSMPEDQAETQRLVNIFKPFFEDESIEKIGQNLKYDIKVLENYKIDVNGNLFDTMLAHYLLQPDMRHNMDLLAETYLQYRAQSIETLIGKKGKNQKSMRTVDPKAVAEYAGEDADITLQLKNYFEPKLEESGIKSVFTEIETPLVKVLADMEYTGIKINKEALNDLSKELETDLALLDSEIKELAGVDFLISSPKQLGEVLFDKLKLVDKPKKTKSGQYATGEEILQGLRQDHEIVDKIMNFREISKLKSTYVDALPKEINEKTGRVHTSFNQAVAATGRLSSNNPNLQNIPIRTERGKKVRAMFVPSQGNVLMAADYSQIELRIIASMSGDENMIKAFKAGEDIHAATAANVFNVDIKEVTREQRSQAKTVNFGIIYGVSAFGLSNQTNLSRSESKALIDAYFETYPGVKKYIDNQVALARENGFVETLLGRRRYLKDINSRNQVVRGHAERNAMNAPIQGSAADIIKLAMIEVYKALAEGNYKSKMLLQVHDELVFDVKLDELDRLTEMVKDKMENAFKLNVPLLVETGTGDNWLQAH